MMKAKPKIKFWVLLATVALVCGAILATSVFATDGDSTDVTPTLSVESYNLSYAEWTHILYAVSNEGFDRTEHEIKMLFWDEPQESYVLGTEAYTSANKGKFTVKEKDCLIFYSDGIAAKEMTDDIYSRAYVEIDGEVYYSEVVKFSVLEYVCAMREKGGMSEEYSMLLSTMLSHGAAAQNCFGYKTDRLANDAYYKVNVVNGTLSDGFTTGRFHEGESIVLSAPESSENYVFSHWEDENGAEVADTANATVTMTGENKTYTAVYNAPVYSQGLKYTLSDDETYYIVSGIGDCTDTDIIIPDTYEGKPVTSIGNYKFRNKTGLTSITIPNSVTKIGKYAFEGCTGLTSVTIGNSVTTMGESAFEGCTGLTSVNINDIASWCKIDFDNRSNPLSYAGKLYLDGTLVTELVIPDSVTNIGYDVFLGCTGLTSVTIGNSVTQIYPYAFEGCTGLTSITIPNSVTLIGYDAFQGCTGLVSVSIDDISSWCKIKFYNELSNPLYYAKKLYLNGSLVSDLVIPDSVTSIGDRVFYGFKGFNSVTISGSVMSIGYEAFYNCDGLTSVTIGDGVTSIGKYAFCDCDELTSVTIPNSVTSIEYEAFYNCKGLKSIKYRGTQAQWNAISDQSKWNYVAYTKNDCTVTYNYTGE